MKKLILLPMLLLVLITGNAIAGIGAPAGDVGIKGAFANLNLSSTGLSASISVSADEIVLENTAYRYKVLRDISVTVNGGISGANGLDSGSITTSTWYSVWIISDGSSIAGLISLSATSPTLPTGYTYKARIGWIRTDSTANKYPLSFKQSGRNVWYVVNTGSNVAAFPSMASGVAGNVSTPTYIAVSLASYVPSTASTIVFMYCHLAGDASINMISSPNNKTGALLSATNPPPFSYTNSAAGGSAIYQQRFALESTSIYWANNNGNGILRVQGWEDNL